MGVSEQGNGGLNWTWWGPDHDDEFMNVLNRHSSRQLMTINICNNWFYNHQFCNH